MKKTYSILTKIKNDRPVTPSMDSKFLHEVKLGLLLALQEQGLLTNLQLRLALEELG
jgi:hypothetical protein